MKPFDLIDIDEDVDFLSGADDSARFLDALDAARQPMIRWAAAALVSRYPEVSPYRGQKGLLACAQDLDFHLSHLRDAIATNDDVQLSRYAPWILAVMAKRGVKTSHVRRGVEVLCEAILRFLSWPEGEAVAAQLRAAFTE